MRLLCPKCTENTLDKLGCGKQYIGSTTDVRSKRASTKYMGSTTAVRSRWAATQSACNKRNLNATGLYKHFQDSCPRDDGNIFLGFWPQLKG